MSQFPHYYQAAASASLEGDVELRSPGLETLMTSPPPQFGGPDNRWSPETLLAGAIADCFVLSFRAIARVSKISWNELSCEVDAKLDRVDGVMRFTEIKLVANLVLLADADIKAAERVLQKSEKSCLITNSMTADVHLETNIEQH